MISLDDIRSYHCPRWDQLPDLELYMDQVMSVLDKNLKIFIGEDPSKAITPTMINNYVKQKLVRAPRNKRYDRGHIAQLYIITLLKQIMSLSEIQDAITCVMNDYCAEAGYNRFCEIFEQSLHLVFFEEKGKAQKTEHPETDSVIRSITLAFANMLYAGYLIAEQLPKEEEKTEKKKK